MEENFSSSTQAIAIWGAITGTIGTITGIFSLLLRIKHQRRDRAILKCNPVFRFEISNGVPSPKFQIAVRCVGRRTIVLEKIEYFYRPDKLKDRIFVRRLWQDWKWRGSDQLDHHKGRNLSEGQKTEIPVPKSRLEHLHKVTKVYVIDEVGRKWKVAWPRKAGLRRETQFGVLDSLKEENSRRVCEISGYFLREEFYLQVRWNDEPPNKNSFRWRTFSLSNKAAYDKNLHEIKSDRIPRLMNEEIDDIS